MTTEVIAQPLLAGVQATFGQGRVFYIKSATAAITVTCDIKGSGAQVRRFINIGAGFKFSVEESKGWTYLRVTSLVNQNLEIIVGDDDVEVANAVSVTGSVTTAEAPSSAVTDTPAVALPNAATTQIVPVNLARKRVTITNPSTALASFFIRSNAGANNLLEMQPGTFAEFRSTARLDGRNDSGGALSALVFEET